MSFTLWLNPHPALSNIYYIVLKFLRCTQFHMAAQLCALYPFTPQHRDADGQSKPCAMLLYCCSFSRSKNFAKWRLLIQVLHRSDAKTFPIQSRCKYVCVWYAPNWNMWSIANLKFLIEIPMNIGIVRHLLWINFRQISRWERANNAGSESKCA